MSEISEVVPWNSVRSYTWETLGQTKWNRPLFYSTSQSFFYAYMLCDPRIWGFQKAVVFQLMWMKCPLFVWKVSILWETEFWLFSIYPQMYSAKWSSNIVSVSFPKFYPLPACFSLQGQLLQKHLEVLSSMLGRSVGISDTEDLQIWPKFTWYFELVPLSPVSYMKASM